MFIVMKHGSKIYSDIMGTSNNLYNSSYYNLVILLAMINWYADATVQHFSTNTLKA